MDLDFSKLQEQVKETPVVDTMWYKEKNREWLFCILLSELSKVFDHYRDLRPLTEVWYEGNKREGITVRLGNFIITILDYLYYSDYIISPDSKLIFKEATDNKLATLIIRCTRLLNKWIVYNNLTFLLEAAYAVADFCDKRYINIEKGIMETIEQIKKEY